MICQRLAVISPPHLPALPANPAIPLCLPSPIPHQTAPATIQPTTTITRHQTAAAAVTLIRLVTWWCRQLRQRLTPVLSPELWEASTAHPCLTPVSATFPPISSLVHPEAGFRVREVEIRMRMHQAWPALPVRITCRQLWGAPSAFCPIKCHSIIRANGPRRVRAPWSRRAHVDRSRGVSHPNPTRPVSVRALPRNPPVAGAQEEI